jgi:hypothetical protein
MLAYPATSMESEDLVAVKEGGEFLFTGSVSVLLNTTGLK